MMADIKDIKKLSAKERLKVLDELKKKQEEEIKKKQKEIEEAEKLITESEKEAKNDQELEEKLAPKQKKINIDDLFQDNEFRELEKIKKRENVSPEQIDYISNLSKKPAEELENRMEYIQNVVQDKGYMTNEQQEEARNIEYAMQQKTNDLEKGDYQASRETIENISMTFKIGKQLKDMYKG